MWNIGDRVLALWPGDRQWWYPGVVCGVDGERFELQFDDGDRSLVLASDIARLEFPEGIVIQARVGRDLRYLPATVLKQRGSALLLRFPNDVELWMSTALMRTLHEASRDWLMRN
jgi:DNA repair protein Crb2 Tudor domain